MSSPETQLIEALRTARRVVVITGAGVSAPSNLDSVADVDLDKLWSPAGFVADVETVWREHLRRRDAARAAATNQAHKLLHDLARWVVDKQDGHTFTLVTQNQDRLHHRAAGVWFPDPADNTKSAPYPLIELHGHYFDGRCTRCAVVFRLPDSLDYQAGEPHVLPEDHDTRYFVCDECGAMARPTVQWLTEPYARGTLDAAGAAVKAADLVLFLGTSGHVQAVRWLLHEARWHARAFTAVVGDKADQWAARENGTPASGRPVIDVAVVGDVVSVMQALHKEFGWPTK